MISEIFIDGYRSLNNFKLNVRPGLNILVGPNGSGKTNIISFFEFLSHLSHHELHEAVSHNGGAGNIFSKRGDTEFKDTINADIYGCRIHNKKKYIIYNYSFSIKVDSVAGQLFYAHQRVKIQLINSKKKLTKNLSKDINWDLDIEVNCNALKVSNNKNVLIHNLDRRKVKNRFNEKFTQEEVEKRLISFYNRNANRSILQLLSRDLDPIQPVMLDMLGGEVFNIIPSKVKSPEDIAKQPGIQKDGTGLASTLYSIKNDRFYIFPRRYMYSYNRPRRISPRFYNKIVNLTKLANDSIKDLTVTNNPFDNQLIVKVTIANSDGEDVILPLSAMSDGTIKWITLITAIISSAQIFSIEEPENFLHPWMQSEIIKIMRNSFNDKNYDSFLLMSTHSETLLNSADPNEIIVVSMKKGVTKAKRVTNIKLLRKEIEETGFGLGYYYLTGGLSNE
ncbi:AAA family ATPase [Maribacter sp. 2210JD10-5]|uniref:AAA family ATPase n=1 Tax=Maribacter sp. 2210JD10-5 TaxID=3386272 RepID=UPI0039BCF7EC